MVHNDALHHPRQAAEGCRGGVPGRGARQGPGQATRKGRHSGCPLSMQARQRKRVALTSQPVPPRDRGGAAFPHQSRLWKTGVFGPRAARGVPSTQPPGRDPAALGGRPVGRLLCHRLHTPLGRGERWNHLPNMQKRREDSFLSGKHGQEGSPCFLY